MSTSPDSTSGLELRVYEAFSGNNSGTYALLGHFEAEGASEALRDELATVLAEQARWLETHGSDGTSAPTPLATFLRERGIPTDERTGTDDDWPGYGPEPVVYATKRSLLVHVPYTVTFPREMGALVAHTGGRVAVELDHAHEPICVVHDVWMQGGWTDAKKSEAAKAIERLEHALEDGALADVHTNDDGEVRRGPLVRAGFWPGQVQVLQTPYDLVAGVRAFDALAQSLGLETRLSLFELPHGTPRHDPLEAFRPKRVEGSHQVILWEVGDAPVAVLRIVRASTGLPLAEASELVARAPVELVTGVAERTAKTIATELTDAGATAEVVALDELTRGR